MSTPHEAPIRVLTTSGLRFLYGLSEHDRSIVAQHWNAVRRFLEYGDDAQLSPFDRYLVTGNDHGSGESERLELETDLESIEFHAVRGEVSFESIYDEVV